MWFGGHVRTTGGMLNGLHRAAAMGFDVAQVFTQSPRMWRRREPDDDAFAEFRRAQTGSRVRATFCHATYLINLASPDAAVVERSAECLAANLRVASGIGSAGLVLHAGSHRGSGLAGCLPRLVDLILEALEVSQARCPLLIENTAGSGGSIGRNVDELAAIVDRAGGDERLGVCIDSQHLWAAGVDFGAPERMDAFLSELDAAVGPTRLQCLHLNDSKVPLGSGRDRHANLGEGEIGTLTLASFLGHPRVQHLPAIMEFEGIEGRGPGPADLKVARRLHRRGLKLYA